MNKTVKVIIAAVLASAVIAGLIFGIVQCTKQKEPGPGTETAPSGYAGTDTDETETAPSGSAGVDTDETETDPSGSAGVDTDETETDPVTTPSDSTSESTDTETDPVETETDKVTETETDPVTDPVTTHTHSYTESITKAATCTEKGEKIFTCSCGDSYTEEISVTEHKWGSWKTVKEASCKEEGSKERTCDVCGKKDTGTIDKKDHNFGDWVVTKEATTSSEGEKERTCKVCGQKQLKTIEKIKESVHKHVGEWKITKNPSTVAEGERELFCTGCYTVIREKIPKIDTADHEHVWGEWIITRQPVIGSQDGMKERYCSKCGDKQTQYIEHGERPYENGYCQTHPNDLKYSNATYIRYEAPTCTEMGYYVYRCQKCGYEFTSWRDPDGVEQNLAPTFHEWGEWVVTKEPDGIHDGEMVKTCKKCGEKELHAIDKTGEVSWGYTVGSRQGYQCVVYGCLFEGDEIAHYGVADYRTWGTAPTLVRTGDNEVTVTWVGKDGEELTVVMSGFDPQKHMNCVLTLNDDGSYYWTYVTMAH